MKQRKWLWALLAVLVVGVCWYGAKGCGVEGDTGEDAQAVFDRLHGLVPEVVAPAAKPKSEAKKMATKYVATGAGTAAANGTYVETGTYNGKPAYQNENGWWLFFSVIWQINATMEPSGPYAYHGGPAPTDGYSVGTGTAPPPTVTLYVPPIQFINQNVDGVYYPSEATVHPSDVNFFINVIFGTVIRSDTTLPDAAIGASTVTTELRSQSGTLEVHEVLDVDPASVEISNSYGILQPDVAALLAGKFGEWTVSFVLKDAAGFELGSYSMPFIVVSGDPPTIAFSYPHPNAVLNRKPPVLTVRGSAASGGAALSKVEVEVNGSGVWLLATGIENWSRYLNLRYGTNTLIAKVTAEDGQTATATLTVHWEPYGVVVVVEPGGAQDFCGCCGHVYKAAADGCSCATCGCDCRCYPAPPEIGVLVAADDVLEADLPRWVAAVHKQYEKRGGPMPSDEYIRQTAANLRQAAREMKQT